MLRDLDLSIQLMGIVSACELGKVSRHQESHVARKIRGPLPNRGCLEIPGYLVVGVV